MVFDLEGKRGEVIVVSQCRPLCTPAPLRNSHPTALAEGCRGAAGEILVLTQAGHNTMPKKPIGGPKTCWEDEVLEYIKIINISSW